MRIHLNLEIWIEIFVKGYRFLSFAKIMGTYLSNKYSQKLLDNVK